MPRPLAALLALCLPLAAVAEPLRVVLDPVRIHVTDADTIEVEDGIEPLVVRLMRQDGSGYDGPETTPGQYDCESERQAGEAAKAALAAMIVEADEVLLILPLTRTGNLRSGGFGRALGVLMLDGQDSGAALGDMVRDYDVREGRQGWC